MTEALKKFYTNHINYVFFAFVIFLPLNEKTSTLLILLLVVLSLIGYFIGNLEVKKKTNSVLWALSLIFIVYLISLVLASKSPEFRHIESKLSLLAFPLIFCFSWTLNKVSLLKFFTIGCALAYLICLGYAAHSSIFLEEGIFVFQPLKSDSRTFFEAIVFEGNNFFGKHFSILHHTTYFGLYLSFALLIVLTYRKYYKKWVLYLLVPTFIIGVIQTMSIAGFGSLFLVISIWAILLIKNNLLKIGFFLSLLIFTTIGISIHPRIKILVNDLTKQELQLNPKSIDGVMLRFLSWDASIDIVKENWMTGVGISDAQKSLNAVYEKKEYQYPLARKFNAHNQYLQLLIECGIIGIIVLTYYFAIILKKIRAFKNEDKVLLIVFLSLIIFNFMFESLLSRYMGISFFSFFTCVLTYSFNKTTDFEKVYF